MEKPVRESPKTTAGSQSKAPRRFPRIERGQILAETAKRVWTQPEFIPRDTKEGIEFVFRVPIRERFKEEDPGLYSVFFGSPDFDCELALKEAFDLPLHDGKKISTMVDSHLYTIFLNMLDQLYRGAEDIGPEFVTYIEKHSRMFKGQARRSQTKARSAKKLSDRVVMEWAKSYTRRKLEARAFIAFIHERRSTLNENELFHAVKENLTFEWIRHLHPEELLRPQNLLPMPGSKQKRAWPLSEFSLTEKQLALAIVRDDFLEFYPDHPLAPRGLDELVIQRGLELLPAESSS